MEGYYRRQRFGDRNGELLIMLPFQLARAQSLAALMAGVAAADATVTYAGDAQNVNGLTTYTFTAAAIGSASADRYVAVVVSGHHSAARTISSVTVAGQATTVKVSNTTVADDATWAIYLTDAPVTTGTTADIVVTWSAGAFSTGIVQYALTGLQSTTATDSQITDTDAATMNLTVSAGGAAIGGGINKSATDRTFITTGLTENVDKTVEAGSLTYTASSAAFASAQSPLAVVVNVSTADSFAAGCVSFR